MPTRAVTPEEQEARAVGVPPHRANWIRWRWLVGAAATVALSGWVAAVYLAGPAARGAYGDGGEHLLGSVDAFGSVLGTAWLLLLPALGAGWLTIHRHVSAVRDAACVAIGAAVLALTAVATLAALAPAPVTAGLLLRALGLLAGWTTAAMVAAAALRAVRLPAAVIVPVVIGLVALLTTSLFWADPVLRAASGSDTFAPLGRSIVAANPWATWHTGVLGLDFFHLGAVYYGSPGRPPLTMLVDHPRLIAPSGLSGLLARTLLPALALWTATLALAARSRRRRRDSRARTAVDRSGKPLLLRSAGAGEGEG